MIRILAIDDNRDNLVVLKAILDEALQDVMLITCESGQKGLQLFSTENPDILLLDLIMPGMDGFEVLRQIRQKQNSDYVPVIILTAAGSERDRRIKALEYGADAFLTKPVDEAELIAQIKSMARIREMEQLKRNEAKRLARLVDERTKELRKQNQEYLRLNKEYVVLNKELSKSLRKIKKMNRDLRIAKEKAEESDKLKTAFLQNISHEIRTPLNAIIGFTSVIASDELPPAKRKEFVDIIYKSNDQLLSIISGIIAIATLETGQDNYVLNETNINQVLLDVYEQFQITKVNPEISFSFHPGLPDDQAIIMTDPVKLAQIIINLVGNAIKFTNNGFVKFGYRKVDENLEFFVEDSGIGIPENMHELIFERFMQVDNSATRKYGGTGLGLALSRGYAKLLGGTINLRSEPGKGSEFKLTIPYQPVSGL